MNRATITLAILCFHAVSGAGQDIDKNADLDIQEVNGFTVTEGVPLPAGGERGGQIGGFFAGKVITAGGTAWNKERTTKFFLKTSYVFKNNKWKKGPDLPIPLAYSMFADDRTGLYVAGGTSDDVSMRKEAFVLKTVKGRLEWKRLPYLPEAFGFGAGAVADGKFYVAGGMRNGGSCGNTMYSLDVNDPAAGWSECRPFPGEARMLYALVANGGYVYLIGGLSDSKPPKYLADVFRYDPKNDEWTRLADLPFEGYAWAAGAVDRDNIIITGRASEGEIHPDIWEVRLADMEAVKIGELVVQSTIAPLVKVGNDEWRLIGGEPDPNRNRTGRISVIRKR